MHFMGHFESEKLIFSEPLVATHRPKFSSLGNLVVIGQCHFKLKFMYTADFLCRFVEINIICDFRTWTLLIQRTFNFRLPFHPISRKSAILRYKFNFGTTPMSHSSKISSYLTLIHQSSAYQFSRQPPWSPKPGCSYP